MGHVFKHLDDLDVAKQMLGDKFKSVELGEADLVGHQAGRSILIDKTWELTPVYSLEEGQFNGPVVWDVWTYERLLATYEDPEGCEEKELVKNERFDKAIKAIRSDMIDAEMDCIYESLYHENMKKDEEIEESH